MAGFLWDTRYISRTVRATENPIRYSESTENFLSWRSHQIFAYLSSSGWKFDPKIVNFHLKNGLFWVVFGYFLGKYLKDFYKTRSEHRENRYEADAKDRRWEFKENFVIILFKVGQNRQIGHLNLWMIQKNRKIFFFVKVSKWSNSQS